MTVASAMWWKAPRVDGKFLDSVSVSEPYIHALRWCNQVQDATANAAMITKSGSDSALILRVTSPLWAFTVISLMPNSPPTCLFNNPETTNFMTARSRGVSGVAAAYDVQFVVPTEFGVAPCKSLTDCRDQEIVAERFHVRVDGFPLSSRVRCWRCFRSRR